MENKKKVKTHLKKTRIYVRAYCTEWECVARSEGECLSIEQAIEWVQKRIINTAMVKGITQYLPEGELYIKNDNYIDPTIIFTNNKLTGLNDNKTEHQDKKES